MQYHFLKKETPRIQTTIDQFHSQHVYQKIWKFFSETKLYFTCGKKSSSPKRNIDLEKDFQPQTQSRSVLSSYAQKLIEVNVSTALLDLSQAFDSKNHKILGEKLDMIGFNTSSRLLIKNFLSHRDQQVKIQNIQSDPVEFT